MLTGHIVGGSRRRSAGGGIDCSLGKFTRGPERVVAKDVPEMGD